MTYPKPQTDRSAPEETAICHCPMVCKGIYIYQENILIMSVNSLVRNPPLLLYEWPKLCTGFELVSWWDWTTSCMAASSQ